MFKVGDKVRRKEIYRNNFWGLTCSASEQHVDGVFTVSCVREVINSITLHEFVRTFDLCSFELVEQNKIKVGDVFKDGYGRSVKIICTDAKINKTPIIGLATLDVGKEMLMHFREDGTGSSNRNHLILPWNQFLGMETD